MFMTQNCRGCVCVCVFMCASMRGAVSCESSAHLPTSPPPPFLLLLPLLPIISSTALNVLQWTFQCDPNLLLYPLFSPHSCRPFFSAFTPFCMSLKELKGHPHLFQILSDQKHLLTPLHLVHSFQHFSHL